jgi:hypothetical protein
MCSLIFLNLPTELGLLQTWRATRIARALRNNTTPPPLTLPIPASASPLSITFAPTDPQVSPTPAISPTPPVSRRDTPVRPLSTHPLAGPTHARRPIVQPPTTFTSPGSTNDNGSPDDSGQGTLPPLMRELHGIQNVDFVSLSTLLGSFVFSFALTNVIIDTLKEDEPDSSPSSIISSTMVCRLHYGQIKQDLPCGSRSSVSLFV